MKCYKCGCNLSEQDFCPNCRADVSRYKKIIYISNRFYNEGLEKANVRDLSGAVNSLRQCLKFNKNNIEARNLLGLVYFETGEVVAALSEWVISQNIRPKKNIANDYIDMIQSNPARLDTINQTIKKYNQALTYCHQDSLDLAVLQLKKVLSLNPKFVRARQLLALLYINAERWEDAKHELIRCSQIDAGNTTTLRYRKEVDDMLLPVDGTKNKKKSKKDDVVSYSSGNELIIQPVNGHDGHGISMIVNISIGILLGIAATWFLIMPARIQHANTEADAKIKVINEQLDTKSADAEEYKSDLEKTKAKLIEVQSQLDSYAGTDGALESSYALIQAANAYLQQPEEITTVADYLDTVKVEDLGEDSSEAPMQLFNTLLNLVGPELGTSFYTEGYNAYNEGDYEVAIENLSRAYQYDPSNGDAIYYLAQSYNRAGNDSEAINAYRKVIENFPDTEKANKSAGYLEQLTGNLD